MKKIRLVRRALLGIALASLGFAGCRRDTHEASSPVNFIQTSASVGKSFQAMDIVEVAPQEFIILATSPTNQSDAWAMRISLNGLAPTVLWQAHIGDPDYPESGAGKLSYANGHLYATLQQDRGGDQQIAVFKLDPDNGATLFNTNLNAQGDNSKRDWLNHTTVFSNGDLIVAATTEAITTNKPQPSPTTDLTDVAVARISGMTGSVLWNVVYGFTGQDESVAVEITPAGELMLAATSELVQYNPVSGITSVLASAPMFVLVKTSNGAIFNQTSASVGSGERMTNGVAALRHDGRGLFVVCRHNTAGARTLSAINPSAYNIQLENGYDEAIDGDEVLCNAAPADASAESYLVGSHPANESQISLTMLTTTARAWSYHLSAASLRASEVRAAKALHTQNGQNLLLITATINDQNQLGILRLDANGNPLP